MAVIDSAYQYYLSTYAGSGMSRYDTHKKASCAPYTIILSKLIKIPPLQNQFHQGYRPFCHRHQGAGPLDREFYRSAFKQCSGRQCGTRFFPENRAVF